MRWPLLLLATLVASSAVASPFAQVLNTNMTMDTVNVATNVGAPYGSNPFMSDSLAMSPAGALFSADAGGVIWNVTTGPFPVGPTGMTQIADLHYSGGGLWGYSNATSDVFFFDLGVSAVTFSANVTVAGFGVVTGVAHQASTGDVFLSAHNALNSDFLLRIPNASTVAQMVGPMIIGDAASYVSDIEFDSLGNLYAVTWFHRWFYTVNSLTGATTFVSAGPHRDTTAMALMPVPEPASALALLAPLIALARRRRS